MTGSRAGGVGVRSAGIVAHSTLTGLMQVGVVPPADCPQAIHIIIPNMWIITCVIHTVIPTMWITRFSIHISWHPRVVQMNGAQTTYRHDKPKMDAPRRKSTPRCVRTSDSALAGCRRDCCWRGMEDAVVRGLIRMVACWVAEIGHLGLP